MRPGAVARVTAGGGRVVHGWHEVPGGGWIVQTPDPRGASSRRLAPDR